MRPVRHLSVMKPAGLRDLPELLLGISQNADLSVAHGA